MSIRMKLLLSYAAMLIVPLFLMVLTALLLVVVFRGDLQNLKSFYESRFEHFEEGEFQHLIKHHIEEDPSILSDPNYLDQLSAEMEPQNSFLVVRLNDQIVYVSAAIRDKKELTSDLPAFKDEDYRDQEHAKQFGDQLYAVTHYDFVSADNGSQSVFILTKVDPLAYFARKYLMLLFICFLVILIGTHSLLTYFMSKNIIRPLLELRKGAKQIKEGNLDFEVSVHGKDEIGQLGVAFEEMRSQLEQSIRLQLQYEDNRKELISNISHDLKTPITAIKAYVDGILDGVADTPEKAEKYIQTISTKATEMDHLIDELFLYSKLDLKRVPFSFEPVFANDFLTDWAEEHRFEMEKRGVNLQFDVHVAKTTKIFVDRDKFKRVMGNILENSVKYMDKNEKEIGLYVTETGQDLLLSIEDNGSGIDQDALPFIFDRFYRAEESRNTYTGGSGLGLAIAKQIMDGHGGDIRAESVKGQGTRVLLTLPIRKEGYTGP